MFIFYYVVLRYTRAANRVVTEASETFATTYPGFITTFDGRIDPSAATAAAYSYPGNN